MSTDWHIRCLTCGVAHNFNDANYGDDFMFVLIKHAKAIAGLKPLLDDDSYNRLEIRASSWGYLDVAFFAAHAEHELAAVSEYGDLQRPGHCVQVLKPDAFSRCRNIPGWVTVANAAECIGHLTLVDCDVDIVICDKDSLPVLQWLLNRALLKQRVPRTLIPMGEGQDARKLHQDIVQQIQALAPKPIKY